MDELIIQMATTLILSRIKNPQTVAKVLPVLIKIAAVITAAVEQLGQRAALDKKIDEEIAKGQGRAPSPAMA